MLPKILLQDGDFQHIGIGWGSRSKMTRETTFICAETNNTETHNSPS